MTDVEGDRDYFDRFVDNSQVLKFIQKKKKNNEYYRQVVFQHDEVNSIFVYGGDVCDKGGSDLYILEQLLNFRELYPDRVFFLLGNRDINKIRITQEIQRKKHDGCWWFKGLNVIGDPLHSNSSNKRIPCDQIERLKWMLKSTMGSPDAFQFRLEELDTVTSTSAVKEKDVLESYLNICRPDGLFGQYIKHAHLILKIDDILFMHGGLPITNNIIQQQLESSSKNHNLWDDFSFATPWLVKESTQTIKKKKKKISFQEWIDMLHDFKTTEYHAWESKFKKTKEIDEEDRKLWCTRGGYEDTRDGEALMQYGMFSMPTGDHKEENPTVVYSSWLYDGMPKMFDTSQKMYQEILQDFFNTTRIKLILTGHKPHGDCALPMRVNHNSGNSWIISADTSYSGDTVWLNSIDQMQNDKKVNIGRQSSKSGRGLQSFCEVLVDYDLSSINQFKHSVEESPSSTDLKSIQFHGVLSDGTRYLSKNLLDENHNHHLGNVIHLKQNEDTKKENLFGDDANHEKNKIIPSSPKTIEDLDQVCVKLKFDTMSGSKSNEADGNEDKYLVSYSKGYDVWNAIVSLSQDKFAHASFAGYSDEEHLSSMFKSNIVKRRSRHLKSSKVKSSKTTGSATTTVIVTSSSTTSTQVKSAKSAKTSSATSIKSIKAAKSSGSISSTSPYQEVSNKSVKSAKSAVDTATSSQQQMQQQSSTTSTTTNYPFIPNEQKTARDVILSFRGGEPQEEDGIEQENSFFSSNYHIQKSEQDQQQQLQIDKDQKRIKKNLENAATTDIDITKLLLINNNNHHQKDEEGVQRQDDEEDEKDLNDFSLSPTSSPTLSPVSFFAYFSRSSPEEMGNPKKEEKTVVGLLWSMLSHDGM